MPQSNSSLFSHAPAPRPPELISPCKKQPHPSFEASVYIRLSKPRAKSHRTDLLGVKIGFVVGRMPVLAPAGLVQKIAEHKASRHQTSVRASQQGFPLVTSIMRKKNATRHDRAGFRAARRKTKAVPNQEFCFGDLFGFGEFDHFPADIDADTPRKPGNDFGQNPARGATGIDDSLLCAEFVALLNDQRKLIQEPIIRAIFVQMAVGILKVMIPIRCFSVPACGDAIQAPVFVNCF